MIDFYPSFLRCHQLFQLFAIKTQFIAFVQSNTYSSNIFVGINNCRLKLFYCNFAPLKKYRMVSYVGFFLEIIRGSIFGGFFDSVSLVYHNNFAGLFGLLSVCKNVTNSLQENITLWTIDYYYIMYRRCLYCVSEFCSLAP